MRSRRRAELYLDQLAEPVSTDGGSSIALREPLRDALERLTPEQRAAFVLRHVLDLSEQEVADAIDLRLGTASSLLARARALLAKEPALQELAAMERRGGRA